MTNQEKQLIREFRQNLQNKQPDFTLNDIILVFIGFVAGMITLAIII